MSQRLAEAVRWNDQGLVSAVVQHARTGVVLMQAWMNQDALEHTRETGLATFWSRSRQSLWVKGETSGNTLQVRELYLDCDGDSLLVLADPAGPACHTGARDCFYRRVNEQGMLVEDRMAAPTELARLEQTVSSRRGQPADSSYVASLLSKGREKILQKVGEEAVETILAASAGDRERVISEAADLLFHLIVAFEEQTIALDDVQAELARRAGVSGLVEKAARKEN